MEVWFSLRGTTAEKPTHAAKNQKEIYTRAPPKRVRGAFALLTKTYHGSRLTVHVGTGTHFYGKRVNQALPGN
jgi:hypothetical protein